jgi:hypothetical protein
MADGYYTELTDGFDGEWPDFFLPYNAGSTPAWHSYSTEDGRSGIHDGQFIFDVLPIHTGGSMTTEGRIPNVHGSPVGGHLAFDLYRPSLEVLREHTPGYRMDTTFWIHLWDMGPGTSGVDLRLYLSRSASTTNPEIEIDTASLEVRIGGSLQGTHDISAIKDDPRITIEFPQTGVYDAIGTWFDEIPYCTKVVVNGLEFNTSTWFKDRSQIYIRMGCDSYRGSAGHHGLTQENLDAIDVTMDDLVLKTWHQTVARRKARAYWNIVTNPKATRTATARWNNQRSDIVGTHAASSSRFTAV